MSRCGRCDMNTDDLLLDLEIMGKEWGVDIRSSSFGVCGRGSAFGSVRKYSSFQLLVLES